MRKFQLFIFVGLLSLCFSTANAQTAEHPWAVGVYGVKTEYLGDMRIYHTDVTTGNLFNNRVNTIYNFDMLHLGGALSLDRYLSRYFDAGIYASYGTIGYDYLNKSDHDYDLSQRNFEATLTNVNLHLRFKFLGNDESRWVPYALLGVGGLGYLNGTTNRNTAIIDPIEESYQLPAAFSEVKLQDTPGLAGIVSLGLGLEYKISSRIGIRYQAEAGWTTADKYDLFVSTAGNDWQLQHSLGLVYRFGTGKTPAPAPTPVPVIVPAPEPTPEPVVVEAPKKEEPKSVVKEEPKPEPKKVIVVNNVLFDTNKFTFNAATASGLDQAIADLKSDNSPILIKGHTDNVGKEKYNQKLSIQRANAVKDYLIKQGIAASRITTKGFGETQPIATNDTAAGRAENRRVEFVIGE